MPDRQGMDGGRRSARSGRGIGRTRRIAVLVIALLAFALAIGRIWSILTPNTVDGRATGSVSLVAGDLGEPDSQGLAGFVGPARPDSASPGSSGTSRIWFAHGRWWGLFPNTQATSMRIWALAGPDGPWVDTGVVVDDRAHARVDVAWTGDRLVVASSGTRDYRRDGLRINRFAYGDTGWSQDPDFPIVLTDRGYPDTQLAVTDDGRVWLARVEGDGIVVSSSDPSNQSFGAFAPLPDQAAVTDVGGFDLESAGAGLLIVWRSASSDTLVVATSDTGGTWSEVGHAVYGVGGQGGLDGVTAGPSYPGLVLVAATTTLAARGTNDEDPSIVLARLSGSRTDISVVAQGRDQLDNPVLVVDPGAGKVHVLAVASPPDPGTAEVPALWSITDKVAELAQPEFGSGQGAVLIRQPGAAFWPPSVPAARVDSKRGFVVTSSGDHATQWTTAQFGGSAPAGPVPVQSGGAAIIHDTFETRTPGRGAPGGWYAAGNSPIEASVSANAVAKGRSLVLANTDGGSAATACRAISPTGSQRLVIRADVTSIGWGSGDARLLTLKGSEGTLVSARLTRRGQAGWSTPQGRKAQGLIADATPLRITVTVDPEAGVARVRLEVRGGALVAEGAAVPLLSSGSAGLEEVCLTPAPGNPTSRLELDDLSVAPG